LGITFAPMPGAETIRAGIDLSTTRWLYAVSINPIQSGDQRQGADGAERGVRLTVYEDSEPERLSQGSVALSLGTTYSPASHQIR
jgi:hypothetical protein